MTTTTTAATTTGTADDQEQRPQALPPVNVVEEIAKYLYLKQRYQFATLLRDTTLHTACYRYNHYLDLDVASKKGNIPLLDRLWRFCQASGLPPRYTDNAIIDPSYGGNVEVLRWWLKASRDVPEKCVAKGLRSASFRGQVHVLDWWKDESGIPLEYNEDALDIASFFGHVAVLQWWKDSGLKLVNTKKGPINAISMGHLDVLDFWLDSRWNLFISPATMRKAADNTKKDGVVKWAIEKESVWEDLWRSQGAPDANLW